MDTQQQLLQVKQGILEDLLPLAIEGQGAPEERAETVLSILELGNTSPELYVKAREIIGSIEDKTLRADLLMRLLGNVQLALSSLAGPEESTPPTEEASQSQPAAVPPQQ
jgi:hypothetical protein